MIKTNIVEFAIPKELVLQAFPFAVALNAISEDIKISIDGTTFDGLGVDIIDLIKDQNFHIEEIEECSIAIRLNEEIFIPETSDECNVISTKYGIGDIVYGIVPGDYSENRFGKIEELEVVKVITSIGMCGNSLHENHWFEGDSIKSNESKFIRKSKPNVVNVQYYCSKPVTNDDTRYIYRMNEEELKRKKVDLL